MFIYYYVRLRKLLHKKISFDKWVNFYGSEVLIHYNLYTNSMEVKNRDFHMIYEMRISPFMFLKKDKLVKAVKDALLK